MAVYDIVSTNQKFGSAYFQRGGKIYIYGGNDFSGVKTDKLVMLSVPENKTVEIDKVLQTNQGPQDSSLCIAVLLPDNQTFLHFGADSITCGSLTVHRYRFKEANWTTDPVRSETGILPVQRSAFTANLGPDGKIYIYGGKPCNNTALNDFWSYDPQTYIFTQLSSPHAVNGLRMHMATMLPTGVLVVFPGLGNGETVDSAIEDKLPDNMTEAMLYNISAAEWRYRTLGGNVPARRCLASILLGPDQKTIYSYGGINCKDYWELKFYNDLYLLDINSWNWTKYTPAGRAPFYRYAGVSGFINDYQFVTAFGIVASQDKADVNVLQIKNTSASLSFEWLSNIAVQNRGGAEGNVRRTYLISILTPVLAVSTYFLVRIAWIYRSLIEQKLRSLYLKYVWTPRLGEPQWNEIVRLDVRFCFEKTYEPIANFSEPHVTCFTDFDYDCRMFMKKLDLSRYGPTLGPSIAKECHLFAPPDWFRLSPRTQYVNEVIDENNNGTEIYFRVYGNSSRFQVTMYPINMDPNRVVFLDETQDVTVPQICLWRMQESALPQSSTNFGARKQDFIQTLTYQISYRQYLQDYGWNYVGIKPIWNLTSEVSANLSPNLFSRAPLIHGVLEAFIIYRPQSFDVVTVREQKMYTIANTIGTIGGMITLLVSIEEFIFGYRPKSPWGVLQRFACGRIKRSIYSGLYSKLDTLKTPVPFASIVREVFNEKFPKGPFITDPRRNESRHNENGGTDLRVEELEKRMQLMEVILREYYLDIKLFKKLQRTIEENHQKAPSEELPTEENRTSQEMGSFYRNNNSHLSPGESSGLGHCPSATI
ncbi:hypothetical protein EC973_006813 [Apophysomyces ossiformis]|uniref:Uncharacterized protein n=1 Tax=Apophysomyces ossiformis TaxID=679940 RepID=A0A8H7EP07_9FUNG|nr:hypothetical protein EC973_006813 [Apophysomyces ossiformis]